MKKIIISNRKGENTKDALLKLGKESDGIKIAVAFFSGTEFLNGWISQSKKITLVVSLRPPTNYYSLEEIFNQKGIEVLFLGEEFHSKFWIFENNGRAVSALLGSSNFTSGGLEKNLETNVVLTDNKYLSQLSQHFSDILSKSKILDPDILKAYKDRYENYLKNRANEEKEQSEFEVKVKNGSKNTIQKQTGQYLEFWLLVDRVKDYILDISLKEYPETPVYLAIDHFWHWIKTEWSKHNEPYKIIDREIIRKLFREYCIWDKATGNHTEEMGRRSKMIFKAYLSSENINKLSKEQAKDVFLNLHFGKKQSEWLGKDKKFIEDNEIEKIRESFDYLLHSDSDNIVTRIDNLVSGKSPMKLKHFGSSAVQEIVGWFDPENYPIRNRKADEALTLIGYDFPKRK